MVLTWPYPPAPGGAERFLAGTGRALSQWAEVSLHYLVRQRGAVPDASANGEPEVHLHRCLALPGEHGERLALTPAVIRVAGSADVLHINQFGTITAQLLAAVGRLRGASVFATDHGSSGVEIGGKIGLHRLFDGFLEGSKFAASFTPPEKTRLVYSGVDLDLFRPGERSEHPFLLYVGRLLPHKGVDWLIRSLPDGARLVVAGRPDPDYRRYVDLLGSLARGRDVRFVFDATDAEIARLYRSAWALVLPSLEEDAFGRRRRIPELFGLTPVEAMASGTPAVVSGVASLPELVRDGETGFIVRPGDVDHLRRTVSRLLRDRSLVDGMGARARVEVEQRFSWEQVAERCLRAYGELGRGRKQLSAGA